jgi:hypothetical protein
MANTQTAYFNGIAFAAAKNMGAVLNTHATEKIKIRRVGLLNAQTAAVTGVLCAIELRLYTATAGLASPTAVVPVKHNSTFAAPASATIGHAGTPSGTATVLRRIFWSSDEAAISTGTLDEWETLVPMNIIWDAGYYDSTGTVEPITLNQNEMISVYNVSGAAGLLDAWIEYTVQ